MRALFVIAFFLLAFSQKAQTDTSQHLEEITISESHWIEASENHYKVSLKDTINENLALNLAEQLKQGSPIFVKSYGSNGIATLNLRGTGSGHTKVYWNGLDISPAGLGLSDLSLLPANSGLEQMEISFGNGALAYSSGNLGGGILTNSKARFSNAYRQNLSLAAGSFGRQQVDFQNQYGNQSFQGQSALSYSSALNNYPYRLVNGEARTQELRNADFDQLQLKQYFSWRKERHIFSIRAWYNQTIRNIPAISLSAAGPYDRMEDRNLYLNLDYQKQLKNQGHLHWIGGAIYSDNEFFLNAEGIPSSNEWFSYQSMLRYKGPQKHLSDQIHLKSEFSLQSRYDFMAATYTNDRWTHGAFAQFNIIHQEDWNAQIQLRQEYISTNNISPLTGSLAFGYQFLPQVQLYANLGRNYRMPALNDLFWEPGGNPNLLAETSYNAEIGSRLKQSFGQWNFNLDLNAFYMDIDNWIQWAPRASLWQAQNLKEVRNKGLSISAGLNRSWADWQAGLDLQYQYLNSTNSSPNNEEFSGNRTVYNPDHNLSSRAFIAYKGLQLTYQLNYSDRYFIDEGNFYYMPSYLVQDLRINYKWSYRQHSLQGFAGINNLGNRDYQIIPWRPEPGLHFILGLQWNWEKE